MIENISQGYIASPYLTLSGYTTPSTFHNLVNYTQATNGFIGRSIIFEEKNTNPRAKKGFRPGKISPELSAKLKSIFLCGSASSMTMPRVVYKGYQVIHTAPEAVELLDRLQDDLHDQADLAMENNGLEAIVRRAFEQVLKVSMILAIGDGFVRTVEHVEWANELVQRDIKNKIELTSASMAEEDKDASAEVLAKVKHALDKEAGQTIGTLNHKLRKISKEHIQLALNHLCQTDQAIVKEHQGARGPSTKRYFLI